MGRLSACWSAAALAAAVFSGSAFATHGGAEHRALGHGSASFETTTQTPILAQCAIFGFPVVVPAGQTTTRTVTDETFDFDSRLTTEEAEDVILSEPHGHMKIALEQTVTTTSQVDFPPPPFTNCMVLGVVPPDATVTRKATASADVTCLGIVANRAAIGGRVTRFQGDFPPTRGLLFNATDNTVARQQLAPDEFAAAFVPEAPQVCPAPSADHPITEGDVFVEQS